MAISDPALDYIESERATLIDFIFRLTGDRSRAGIIANEVCSYVHRELMSTWTQQDIRVELFAYAYEINAEAHRGVEKSFFEIYYRNQFADIRKVSVFFPLEAFLVEIGPKLSLIALLQWRYAFSDEAIARILDSSLEAVADEKVLLEREVKAHPKIQLEEAKNLPMYDFLVLPEVHPTAISRILGDMRPAPFRLQPKTLVVLVLLGLLLGVVAFYIVSKI